MPIPTKKTKNNLEGERWETVMTTLRSMNQLQKASEQLLRQLVDTKQHEQVQQQQQEEEEKQRLLQEKREGGVHSSQQKIKVVGLNG